MSGPVTKFIQQHFRHFNAAALVDAADAYAQFIERGGRMFLAMAGAMSTAELGLSLAAMIRQGKVHAIACTGANLEEDVYNLVAHDHYERIRHYRELTPSDEKKLLDRHLNRVTDTCIPEDEAIRRIEHVMLGLWQKAQRQSQRYFPHEYFYQALREGLLRGHYQIDPANSWLVAAMERDLPIFVPGWEDSTLGNIFLAHCLAGDVSFGCMKTGVEYMGALARWYIQTTMGQDIQEAIAARPSAASAIDHAEPCPPANAPVGFFQIGGGIAGDFPICVVPMLHQDLRLACPCWAYFCQISDATTSYGGYSGAVPNEKITWGKLAVDTPKYLIESDATIVAPLIFARVLGW